MKKNNSVYFLVMTFAISLISWGIILVAQSFGWFQYGSAISIILIGIGGNSPAIASFLAMKRESPSLTIKQFLRETFVFRQKPVAYLFAVILIAIFFIIPALMGAIGSTVSMPFGDTGDAAPLPLWLTILCIPLMLIGGGAEELGWRYYLQPRLEEKTNFYIATAVLGLIWSVWHLPLFYIIGTVQHGTSFLVFTISVIGLAFALAAIRRMSTGALLCILFHCATNSLQGTWPITDNVLSSVLTSVGFIAISILIASTIKRKKPLSAL